MKLSPLLREKLGVDPVMVKCVIEVKPDKLDHVLSELKAMGITVDTSMISQPVPGGDYYIPAYIPSNYLDQISKIEGVVYVYKSVPVSAQGFLYGEGEASYYINDELLGRLAIPSVEIPREAMLQILPNPTMVVKSAGAVITPLTGLNPITDVKIVPTGITYKILKDVKTKDGEGITVAVLDTGSPRFCYQCTPFVQMKIEDYTVLPEPPQDMMGHGSWCANTVFGPPSPSIYGAITGGAPNVRKAITVKVLNTFPGTGSTEGILKGIEIAVSRGAKVISMSLGGPAQGNMVDEDPMCKVVNELSDKGVIFSIAMGNSGPNTYTGGSPGIALKAITVASASITDKFNPAWWSSRGPGSDWDGKHKDEYYRILSAYGVEAIKPDCTALGGGRSTKGARPDEVIFNGCVGWFEGFYDGIKETAGSMHGTSQATPHVAGLIACMLSDGIISTYKDVKKGLQDTANDFIIQDPLNPDFDNSFIETFGKSIATGWGLFVLSRFYKERAITR